MRYWRLTLAFAILIGAGVSVYSPFSAEWRSADPDGALQRFGAIFAGAIPRLFLIVLALTTLGFVGVEAVLAWTRFRAVRQPGVAAKRHWGGWGVEAAWSIVPAAILASLALYQSDVLAAIGLRPTAPRVPVLAELTGEGPRWIIKYSGPDGVWNTADDLRVVDELHVVKGQTTLVHLRAAAAAHSFSLPRLGVDRAAEPGAMIPVWFTPDAAGRFEMVCADNGRREHCDMEGEVVVHETEEDFQNWLAQRRQSQPTAASDGREENHP